MKEKRLAVMIGRCLTVCMLALPLNVMTASAEASDAVVYGGVREAGSEAEITIGVSGYVQMPAAVTPGGPGIEEPEADEPGEDTVTTTPVSDIKKAAPQTKDNAHTEQLILQLMLAGIMIGLMIRQTGDKGTRNMRVPENTL